MLGTYHLNALFELLNRVHSVYNPEELWRTVLEQSCKTLQSTAAVFYETSEDEQTLKPVASTGIDLPRLSKGSFRIGVGFPGWVAQFHQPLLVVDVRTDNRFHRQADTLTGFQTKSALCIPVFSQKRLYGVIEILNRQSGQFNISDQEFMSLLGRQVAIAYENWLLMAEVSTTKDLLENLLANFSGGLVAADKKGIITIFNPAAGRLLQMKTEALVGKPTNLVFMDLPWFEEMLSQTVKSDTTVSRQEMMLAMNGEQVRFGYTTILISNREKEVLGSGIIFQKF